MSFSSVSVIAKFAAAALCPTVVPLFPGRAEALKRCVATLILGVADVRPLSIIGPLHGLSLRPILCCDRADHHSRNHYGALIYVICFAGSRRVKLRPVLTGSRGRLALALTNGDGRYRFLFPSSCRHQVARLRRWIYVARKTSPASYEGRRPCSRSSDRHGCLPNRHRTHFDAVLITQNAALGSIRSCDKSGGSGCMPTRTSELSMPGARWH